MAQAYHRRRYEGQAMTEPVQVFGGSDKDDRADRAHRMVCYLIEKFAWKFEEADRSVLMERTENFLNKLDAAKHAGRKLSLIDLVGKVGVANMEWEEQVAQRQAMDDEL